MLTKKQVETITGFTGDHTADLVLGSQLLGTVKTLTEWLMYLAAKADERYIYVCGDEAKFETILEWINAKS